MPLKTKTDTPLENKPTLSLSTIPSTNSEFTLADIMKNSRKCSHLMMQN